MRLISREESLKIWDSPLSDEHFQELRERCLSVWEIMFKTDQSTQDYIDEKMSRIKSIKNTGDAFALLQMFHPLLRWNVVVPALNPDLQQICEDAFLHEVTTYRTREDGTIEIETE